MQEMKLCPKCVDGIVRGSINLNVDIASLEPSIWFYVRVKIAKPFFWIGGKIIGSQLKFNRTWGVIDGGQNEPSQKENNEKGH